MPVVSIFSVTNKLSKVRNNRKDANIPTKAPRVLKKKFTAIVYCEAKFATPDGETANELVRCSEKYQVLSIIDSEKAGLDSGMVLDDKPNNIPICRNLIEALELVGIVPDYFIVGMAPSGGALSMYERSLILEAINYGMHIVNAHQEFLNGDSIFTAASAPNDSRVFDLHKSRARKSFQQFSGRIAEVTCPRIAVLGTDCAIGKRTTAILLTRALNDYGLKALMIGTGQTGFIQGVCYGVALDSIPSQFCAGELEAAIIEVFENEAPDVIVVEGQDALSHPAFTGSASVLRGSSANAVILQHAPGRAARRDFVAMAMPLPETEINLIEAFADTKVIGLTLNHENMTDAEVDAAIVRYEEGLGIPVTDVLTHSPSYLVRMVLDAFPDLQVSGKKGYSNEIEQ